MPMPIKHKRSQEEHGRSDLRWKHGPAVRKLHERYLESDLELEELEAELSQALRRDRTYNFLSASEKQHIYSDNWYLRRVHLFCSQGPHLANFPITEAHVILAVDYRVRTKTKDSPSGERPLRRQGMISLGLLDNEPLFIASFRNYSNNYQAYLDSSSNLDDALRALNAEMNADRSDGGSRLRKPPFVRRKQCEKRMQRLLGLAPA